MRERIALSLGFALGLAMAPVVAWAQSADPYTALDATLGASTSPTAALDATLNGAPVGTPALADPNAFNALPDLTPALAQASLSAPGVDMTTLIRSLETLLNLGSGSGGGGGPPPPTPFPGGGGGGGGAGGPPPPVPFPAGGAPAASDDTPVLTNDGTFRRG